MALDSTASTICVNALWTVSLLVNVLGASLALFFKLWLQLPSRGKDASPRSYLRARHFRNATRNIGRLIDPVGVLSYILQLSIALFLVGLYLSAVDSNPDAWRWTAAFIAGCAILTLLASRIPIMWPQYLRRMPFFRLTMTHRWAERHLLRPHHSRAVPFTQAVPLSLVGGQQLANITDDEDADMNILISIYAAHLEEGLLTTIWDALREYQARPEVYLRFVENLVHAMYPVELSVSATGPKAGVVLRIADLGSLPPNVYSTILDLVSELLDEEIIRQTATNDAMPIEWKEWMAASIHLLLGRSPYRLPSLTSSILNEFMTPNRSADFYAIALRSMHGEACNDGTPAQVASATFEYIFDILGSTFDLLGVDTIMMSIVHLLLVCFCNHDASSTRHEYKQSPLVVLSARKGDIPVENLAATGNYLLKRLTIETRPQMFWHVWLLDMVCGLMHILDVLPIESPARQEFNRGLGIVTRMMLLQSANTAIFLRYAAGRAEKEELYIRVATGLFIDVFVAEDSYRQTMLDNIRSALLWQLNHTGTGDQDNTWDTFIRLHPLKTCHLLLQSIQRQKLLSVLPGGDVKKVYMASLLVVWSTLSKAFPLLAKNDMKGPEDQVSRTNTDGGGPADQKTQTNPPSITYIYPDEEVQRATECLEEITSFESLDVPANASDEEFEAWAKKFDSENSYIPDTLIQALGAILPPSLSRTFPRVRRLSCLVKPSDAPCSPEHSQGEEAEGV